MASLVHLLSLVAGGLYLVRVNRDAVVLRRRMGVPRRGPPHDAVVRPAPRRRTTSTGARRRTSIYRLLEAAVRDPLVLAVHPDRDPASPRRRPSRLAGDAAGPGLAVGGDGRRAAADRPRSRSPEPALGVPDRLPRVGRARPRGDSARRTTKGRLEVAGLGRRWRSRSSRCSWSGVAVLDGRHLHARRRSCGAGSGRPPRSRSRRRPCTWSGPSRTRRRPISRRRRCARSPTACGRSSRQGLSTAADAFVFDLPLLGSLLLVAARRLPRPHGRARDDRGSGGIRVRARSGGPVPCSLPTGG